MIIRSPTGGETGRTNCKISTILGNWNEQAMPGKAFDSPTGFSLYNGVIRSPDAAWVLHARWDALSS